MYKIAVIGDPSSVLGFKAVGLSVFPVSSEEEAREALKDAAAQDHAIIYMTESVMKDIMPEVDKYKDSRIPAIIPIPGMDGTLGIGIRNVKKSVERAVGADILFGGN